MISGTIASIVLMKIHVLAYVLHDEISLSSIVYSTLFQVELVTVMGLVIPVGNDPDVPQRPDVPVHHGGRGRLRLGEGAHTRVLEADRLGI